MDPMGKMQERYIDWMLGLIGSSLRETEYSQLIWLLYGTDFRCSMGQDVYRIEDGFELRRQFSEWYPAARRIRSFWKKRCSVLELMIALAKRCEENIMEDPVYGDRTGQWFFEMLKSLGLDGMTDDAFDGEEAADILERFLDREYGSNGAGGLFTVRSGRWDMRRTDIWYQMMHWLTEYIYKYD